MRENKNKNFAYRCIMAVKNQLDKLLISLDVGEKNALLIILTKDGTICRRGNGSGYSSNMPLLKGSSYDGHFEALLMTVSEETLLYAGVFNQDPKLGKDCQLMIIFNGKEEQEINFKCTYGENSQGPPQELVQIIINAVKLTDPWYKEEIENLKTLDKNSAETKKWWEVWK